MIFTTKGKIKISKTNFKWSKTIIKKLWLKNDQYKCKKS